MSSEQMLENGLLLRTVHDEADIQKYIEFNSTYNNPNEGLNTDLLIRHYPGAQPENFWLVEQPASGQIVATTCLIPWEMSFEGVPLRAAQMEQVLSRPDFRRQGLVRILVRRFMQAVQERGYDLSFIWGIPYYYRQYGYAYAIPGNCYESLPSTRIPEAVGDGSQAYTFRKATAADCQLLTRLYQQNMLPYALTLRHTEQHWRYLLEYSRFPVEIVLNTHSGQPAGYFGACTHPDFPGFSVIENALSEAEAALPVLQRLKTRAEGELQVFWPQDSALASLAQKLGSHAVLTGQWLFHITDLPHFLMTLAPVFEKRLFETGYGSLTREITINLYRQAYRLDFRLGKLTGVFPLGFVDSSMGADGGDLCIPPDAFVRLLLADSSLDRLWDAWPDIAVKLGVRSLLDAVFPSKPSYLCATYASFSW
jgi:GNAT superfamily N-acetyltransferase